MNHSREQGPVERPGHKRKLFSKNERRAAHIGIGTAVIVWVYGMLCFYQSQYTWMQSACSWLEFTAGCCAVLVPLIWALILFMKPVEKTVGKVREAVGPFLSYTGYRWNQARENQRLDHAGVNCNAKIIRSVRTHARAYRGHTRPSFANAGGNNSDDGSGSGDEPPEPKHSATPPNPSEKPVNPNKQDHPWRRPGSWRAPGGFYFVCLEGRRSA